MKSEIKDRIQKLSAKKQLDLLYQIAIIKLDKFLNDNQSLSDEVKRHLGLLSFYLLLPSDLIKEFARQEKNHRIKANEDLTEALKFIRHNRLVNEYLDLENKDLSKRLYMDALYLHKEKKKYITDLSMIKDSLKLIIPLLKADGMEIGDITYLIFNLYIHFNFENAKYQNYESLKKKISMMIHRL